MSKKGAGDIALNVITSHHAKSALSLKNAIPDLIWFNLGDFWATVTVLCKSRPQEGKCNGEKSYSSVE